MKSNKNGLSNYIYLKNQKIIKSVARRYSKLDPAVGCEDLMSEGYLAILSAVNTFDQDSDLSFSSHLWWHLQKRFSQVLGKDKVVEIKIDGRKEIISYDDFLRMKRNLPREAEWRVVSLLTSIEESAAEMGGWNWRRENEIG